MRVAIVGNGPSQRGFGAEIDACDFVVRCNDYAVRDPAGVCMDAWAWSGTSRVCPDRMPPPQGAYRVWCTVAPCAMRGVPAASMDRICRLAEGRLVRFQTDAAWCRLSQAIGSGPSTGIGTVSMAIDRFDPEELCLFGFDLLGVSDDHDFSAEKRVLAALADHQWLGGPINTRLSWYGRPDGV